jgi:rare lipoprotein A
MKRALLKSTLAVLAVCALAFPAAAASYDYASSYSDQEWMSLAIGRGDGDEGISEDRPYRGKRASRHARRGTETAHRAKRRLPAMGYDDVGTSHGGQSGMASYYWQPQRLASGGRFNPNGMTAAHKSLPFGTKVRVTHQASGRSVMVTINDRGPYVAGRIIDLSSAAAGALGIKGSGVARVSLSVLGR